MVQSAEAFTTYNPKQPSRSDGDPMYRYPSQEYEEPEIPFLPSVPYNPNAVVGVGPLAVVLGLGAWIMAYGPRLGTFLWEKAEELEKLRSVAVNKLKQVPTEPLQRNTMGDLSGLEANNPKAFKKVSARDKKAWVGGKTMKQADKDITQSKKLEAQRARESLSRDKPPSKFNPNKGKSTRPQSLLGSRINKKKPKK